MKGGDIHGRKEKSSKKESSKESCKKSCKKENCKKETRLIVKDFSNNKIPRCRGDFIFV